AACTPGSAPAPDALRAGDPLRRAGAGPRRTGPGRALQGVPAGAELSQSAEPGYVHTVLSGGKPFQGWRAPGRHHPNREHVSSAYRRPQGGRASPREERPRAGASLHGAGAEGRLLGWPRPQREARPVGALLLRADGGRPARAGPDPHHRRRSAEAALHPAHLPQAV
ncbi:MAG: hypothetical protein AVDCRST_MAG68-4389, partial [uncultured Gemmatimonadetes bacterium]